MCQGCTNFGREVLITSEFCTVAFNAFRSLLELAPYHPSDSSNCEMAVRLLEVSCAPAVPNAYYIRRLKFGHFSVFVIFIIMSLSLFLYISQFICIHFVSSNNVRPETHFIPALCDVKPTCLSCDIGPSVLE